MAHLNKLLFRKQLSAIMSVLRLRVMS